MDAADAAPRPQVQAAQKALAEARQGRFPFKDYVYVLKQVPRLLQRHGLGQTLACLQLRAGGSATSPYDLMLRQLDRWLLEAMGVSGRSALAVLSARDSRFYAEASEQAWLFVRALQACVEEGR